MRTATTENVSLCEPRSRRRVYCYPIVTNASFDEEIASDESCCTDHKKGNASVPVLSDGVQPVLAILFDVQIWSGRTIWIVDAHCGDGKRYIVRTDEKLSAFLELDSAID